MITQSINYVNDYGFGFEALVGNSAQRVELDLNYIDPDGFSEDSLGICMTAEAAKGLADLLYKFANKLEDAQYGI